MNIYYGCMDGWIFFWYFCAAVHLGVCNKQCICVFWTCLSLTRSLDDKKPPKNCTFRPAFSVVYFSCFKIATCQPCTLTHLFFTPACPWAHKWVLMHLLFEQHSTGLDTCARLKTSSKHLHVSWCHIALGVWQGTSFLIFEKSGNKKMHTII